MNDESIKTAGELREFIAKTIQDVRTGRVDVDKASRIAKLAAQVNESFYVEVKIAKFLAEAGKDVHPLGDLPLNTQKASA